VASPRPHLTEQEERAARELAEALLASRPRYHDRVLVVAEAVPALLDALSAERAARAFLAEVLAELDAADPNDTLGLHAQAINQAAGVACGSRAVPRPVPAGPADEDSPF
jgi:hypothetical protein